MIFNPKRFPRDRLPEVVALLEHPLVEGNGLYLAAVEVYGMEVGEGHSYQPVAPAGRDVHAMAVEARHAVDHGRIDFPYHEACLLAAQRIRDGAWP